MALQLRLALLLVLVFGTTITDASHFRYGSIFWKPTTETAALPDSSTGPFVAEFEMSMAFRRDYFWGAYYKEAWMDKTVHADWQRFPMPQLPYDCAQFGADANGNAIQCFLKQDRLSSYIKNYRLLFPAGMAVNGFDLKPNNDGLNTYNPDGTKNPGADAENYGGYVCVSPDNKGYDGDWKAPGPFTIGNSPELAPHFARAQPYPGSVTEINKCTPWNEVFGFFFGDQLVTSPNATYKGRRNSAHSAGVMAEVKDISFSDTDFGNYIQMEAIPFTHTYETALHPETNKPYIAYFTGGNRLHQLNNNANGRYRLEIEVAFVAPFRNRSPIATNIPVLPLPYVDAPNHVQFQIAAFDPDIGDQVRFFLGTVEEYGGLLGNIMWETDSDGFTAVQFNWHEDVYNVEGCQRKLLPASVCTDAGAVGATLSSEYVSQGYVRIGCSSSTDTVCNGTQAVKQMPPWDAAKNKPSSPPNLAIDPKSGLVTWQTGKDPFNAATGAAANSQLSPGFYNLVVMVEERRNGVAEDIAVGQPTVRGSGIKVPLDFLLYLYPRAHMCSGDCDAGALKTNMTTLETTEGVYGDPDNGPRKYVLGDDFGNPLMSAGFGLPGNGTGQCKMCGGGGTSEFLYGGSVNMPKVVKYEEDALKNTTKYCVPQRIATGQAVKSCCYAGANTLEFGTQYFSAGCLGAGTADSSQSIVPYVGSLDSCLMNTPPYFLTQYTTVPRAGPTPGVPPGDAGMITSANAVPEEGLFPGSFRPAVVQYPLGADVKFDLEAYDPDHCVELQIGHTGLYDSMFMYPHQRIDERTVRRIFLWPSPSKVPLEDSRQRRTKVCFYAFDRYMATVLPFLCIQIDLIEPRIVKWCDHNTPGQNSTVLAPADSVVSAYMGEETCIPLCVEKSDMRKQYKGNLDIRMVDTAYAVKFGMPNASTPNFAYPFDEVNFPSNGELKVTLKDDPHYEKYCFTPQLGQECAYVTCFQGIDLDTVNPSDTEEAVLEYTNVRCVKIEVHNTVLEFNGQEFAMSPMLSQHIEPMAGMSMSAWLYPKCRTDGINEARNNTAFYFASNRTDVRVAMQVNKDKPMRVRNGIKFIQEAGKSYGSFVYFDDWIGPVLSPSQYACDMFHYVAVTMQESGVSHLIVDGIEEEAPLPGSRDVRTFSVTSFTSKSRPDSMSMNATGHFFVGYLPGEGWHGMIDEVRVWNKALTLAEVKSDMHLRVVTAGADAALKASFQMRDGVGTADFPLFDYSGNGNHLEMDAWHPFGVTVKPMNSSHGIPSIVPCVLGMQHTVGPTTGGCKSDVYAWNAAPSPFAKCSINGVQSRATFVKANTMSCETPGHFTPRFTPVVASNDGTSFGEPSSASKEVHHLYMDSVLYVKDRDSTAEMDSLCYDLPDRTVTFSGWFCPGCALPDPPAPTDNNRTGSYELDVIKKAAEAAAKAAAALTTTTTNATAATPAPATG